MTISSLGTICNRVNVAEALKSLFPTMAQIIGWENARNEPISVENLSPEIEAAIEFRARRESSNVLGDSQQVYINQKLCMTALAGDVEKQEVLQLIKELMYEATLKKFSF